MTTETSAKENSDNSELRSAIRAALGGNAVLFLGAGAAKSARSKKGKPLPTGQELSDSLASDCSLEPGYPLDSIADHFLDVLSETTLINALRKHLNVQIVGSDLIALGAISWSRIWTTNYDNAFEKALDENNVNYFSLTTAADVKNAQGNRLLLIHINGALDQLKQSLTSDFVLTSQSYATQAFVDKVWATIFRNDLQRAKAIIFVGYSLADIDIARLIFNPSVFRSKVHFIDQGTIDPVLKTKLSRFGTVHTIGLDGFIRTVEQEKDTWEPPVFIEEYQCWSRVRIEANPRTPSDDDFYDLILNGVTHDELLLSQFESPDSPSYTVVRNCEEICIKHLGQQNSIAAIIGSFANGKTITLRSIAVQLVAYGRDVFFFDHRSEVSEIELQKLCKRDSDFVVILENYSRNLDLLECFCRYAREDCTLLTSERTEIHELSSPALIERTKERNLNVYEIDILENDEVSRLSALLDLRGLWGDRAGLKEIQRLAYLKEDCGRQMHAVLIDIAKAPQVKSRLNEIVTHFESREGGLRILVTFCLLQAIGEQPRIDVASELLKLSYDAFNKLTKDNMVKRIVATQSGVARFRSPIIASAVLSGLKNATIITEIVSDCVKHGHLARNADKHLGFIAKELTRYGNLERILPEKGKRPALQNLYEDLKTVPSIRGNPHFWLQLRIPVQIDHAFRLKPITDSGGNRSVIPGQIDHRCR